MGHLQGTRLGGHWEEGHHQEPRGRRLTVSPFAMLLSPMPSWEPRASRGVGSKELPRARLLHKLPHLTSPDLDHALVRGVCTVLISQMKKLRPSY